MNKVREALEAIAGTAWQDAALDPQRLVRIAREALASLSSEAGGEAHPTYAKYQPCGCVLCTCQTEDRCLGCGGKHCGNHKLGDRSGFVKEPTHPPAPVADVGELPEGCPETAFFDPMDGQIHSDEQSGEEVVVEIHPVGTRARLAATEPPSAPCVWKEDQDGVWHGACGIVWTFHDGGPEENGVNCCPACGKPCTGALGPEACEEEEG